MNKEKLLSKDYILFFAASIVISMSMNMTNVLVPLYVTEDLGGSKTIAGLMGTICIMSACIFRVISAGMGNKVGYRLILALGIVLFSIGSLFMGLFSALGILMACRIIMGAGYSSGHTMASNGALDVTPKTRLAEGVSFIGMAPSVGSALGPSAVAFIINAVGNRSTFYYVAAFCMLGLIPCFFIKQGKRSTPEANIEKKQDNKGNFLKKNFEKAALVPSVFEGLNMMIISFVTAFTAIYLVSKGFNTTVAGTFFLFSSISIVLLRLLTSKLLKVLPIYAFTTIGYLALIVFSIIMPWANEVWQIYLLAIVFGIGHGGLWMIFGAVAVENAAPEKKGAANAMFFLAFDLFFSIGSVVWGALIDNFGFGTCYKLFGIFSMTLMVIAFICYRKKGCC